MTPDLRIACTCGIEEARAELSLYRDQATAFVQRLIEKWGDIEFVDSVLVAAEPDLPTLTPGQKRVLQTICALTDLRRYPPTVREIAGELSIGESGVMHHLKPLESKGWIRSDGLPRTIVVLHRVRGGSNV